MKQGTSCDEWGGEGWGVLSKLEVEMNRFKSIKSCKLKTWNETLDKMSLGIWKS